MRKNVMSISEGTLTDDGKEPSNSIIIDYFFFNLLEQSMVKMNALYYNSFNLIMFDICCSIVEVM